LFQIIFNISVERWEIGSFAKLGLRVGLCGFANVPMCGWLKLFFKMCGGKIFKTLGAVCVSSKSVRKFMLRCQSSIFRCLFFRSTFSRLAYNVLGLCEEAELEAQMFSLAQMSNRIPNVQYSTEPAFLQNPCYALVPFSSVHFVSVCRVVVRWLGSSFGFFFVWLCALEKNTNVLPKALAKLLVTLPLSF